MMPIAGGMPSTEVTPIVEAVAKQNVSFEGALQESGFEAIVGSGAAPELKNGTSNKIDISLTTNVTPTIRLLPGLSLDQNSAKAPEVTQERSPVPAIGAAVKKLYLVNNPITQKSANNSETAAETSASSIPPVATPDSAQTSTPLLETMVPAAQQSDGPAVTDIKMRQKTDAAVQLTASHEEVAGNQKTPTAVDVGKDNVPEKKITNHNLYSQEIPEASIASAPAPDLQPINLQVPTIPLPNVDAAKPGTTGVISALESKLTWRPREHKAAATISSARGEPDATTTGDAPFIPPDELDAPMRLATETESADNNTPKKPAEAQPQGTTVTMSHVSVELLTPPIAPVRSSFGGEGAYPLSASVSAASEVRNDAYGNVAALTHESGGLTHGPMTKSTTASTTSLEVGVAGGTHGWLRVRAELEDGVVTASLTSPSAAGRDALHRELPSLMNYLREGQIGLGAVVVRDTSAAERRDGFSSSNFSGHGQQSQARDQAHNRSSGPATAWGPSDEQASQQVWREFGTAGVLPSLFAGSTGGWLNVRV